MKTIDTSEKQDILILVVDDDEKMRAVMFHIIKKPVLSAWSPATGMIQWRF